MKNNRRIIPWSWWSRKSTKHADQCSRRTKKLFGFNWKFSYWFDFFFLPIEFILFEMCWIWIKSHRMHISSNGTKRKTKEKKIVREFSLKMKISFFTMTRKRRTWTRWIFFHRKTTRKKSLISKRYSQSVQEILSVRQTKDLSVFFSSSRNDVFQSLTEWIRDLMSVEL